MSRPTVHKPFPQAVYCLSYNPVDAFNNRAGTLTSFGYGWTSEHDVSFLPFAGSQKRLVMAGGQFVN